MAGVCSAGGVCDTRPTGTPGGKANWVDRTGGLSPYLRAIVHALIRSGHTQSEAIQIGVGTLKRWAAGGGNVSAATRARAAAALADWEAKRGAAHLTAEATVPIDLATSVPYAASNDGPQMTMTVGQHMAALRKLASAHKRAGPSKRPKLRAAMAVHAKAIQTARKKG